MSDRISRLSGGRLSAQGLSRRGMLGVVAALVFSVAATAAPAFAKPQSDKAPATMLPLQVVDVSLNAQGQLVAALALGNLEFEVPVTLEVADNSPANTECPVLDLTLGPIDLDSQDLNGLNVETSDICLNITATRGPNNGLANLLCGIGNLLDDGQDLDDILVGLTDAQEADLLEGIVDLLNSGLASATAPNVHTAVTGTRRGACDILNLSVGGDVDLDPSDTNLMGLDVVLDDCDGGPVTIEITAEHGRGSRLSKLLCNLAILLDRPANANAVANALNRVANAILDLTGAHE